MKKLSIVIILASALIACMRIDVQSIPLQTKVYTAIPIDSVTIFLDKQDLPARFEKVAMIYSGYNEGDPSDDVRNWKSMWEQIRRQTAKLGCNGVYEVQDASNLNLPIISRDSTQRVIVAPTNKRRGMFIAIKY